MVSTEKHFADRLVARSLRGGIPMALFIASLLAGTFALLYTPREEEPQIVVPTLDVLVTAPGLSAAQVARQVTIPLEKLLTQIPGVEHVYSSSMSGRAVATLRFFVGEDREKSILNTYNKIYSNQDKVPEAVSNWLVRAVDVDDVPILLLALWSDDPERYSDFALRRIADELSTALQSIPQTSEVSVSGGRPRTIQVLLDAEGMAARKTSSAEIVRALALSNSLSDAGEWTMGNQSIEMQSGDFLRSPEELESLLVNVIDGTPVYLRDVASVVDGPADTEQYTWIRFAGASDDTRPMVAISIAKQKGQNAVRVARAVHEQVARLSRTLLPPQVHVEVLRDYGETANEKVNNLSLSLGFAMVTVVIFIGVFLGLRPALVVGLAIPICYGFTLALDFAFGYTINRVTLFALILSLGLLVDDPITGVDNIERFLRRKGAELGSSIVAAMAEIRTPLIMSTVTIVLAFVPLAFITGMMGPYMAPMAFNVPVSVIASTGVAFLVTPWLASKLLRPASDEVEGDKDSAMARVYQRLVGPLLRNRRMAWATLWLVAVLFLLAAVLPAFRLVPLKLLPFDNKSELQLLIEMPESS
ncbi:MAG TPA: efflux RND transporter permease subunit, partial [Xanthomonadales bacterium]|nr:efflux RND transporter permease subunit [Xanthomonadales bacterium]